MYKTETFYFLVNGKPEIKLFFEWANALTSIKAHIQTAMAFSAVGEPIGDFLDVIENLGNSMEQQKMLIVWVHAAVVGRETPLLSRLRCLNT